MSDWTTDAADAIDNAVGLVRERTVEPVQAVARVVIYGLLAALILLPALTLLDDRACSACSTIAATGNVWAAWCVARRNLRGRRVVLLDQAQSATEQALTARRRADEAQAQRGTMETREVIIIGSGPGRPHRRDLHRARQPAAARDRGHRRRRPAHAHHRRRELPRLPRRHPRPRAHGAVPRAGRALRRRVRHRRRRPRRPLGVAVRGSGSATTEYAARRVIISTGAQARMLGLPIRAAAARPRRVHLRDLRRVLLPRPATSRSSAAATPRSRRRSSSPSSPTRSRSCTGARSCARRRSCRTARSRTRRSSSAGTASSTTCIGDGTRRGAAAARHRDRRDVSDLAVDRRVRRDRPRPEHQAVRRPARPRRRRLHRHRARLDARPRCRACSRPATCRTTCTARRSPRPARAAWPRSKPSATSKRSETAGRRRSDRRE